MTARDIVHKWTINNWKRQSKTIQCDEILVVGDWKLRLKTRRLTCANSLFALTVFAADPVPEGKIEFVLECRLGVGTFRGSKQVILTKECTSDTVYPHRAWISEIDKLCKTDLDIEFKLRDIKSVVKAETRREPMVNEKERVPEPPKQEIPKKVIEHEPILKQESFVGLQNQGATCYMNSILQALFHLTAFRRIVYSMPTENVEDAGASIPLNMQALFYEMQTGSKACSTRKLTKSFGWDAGQAFVQHDIQEFLRVLASNIEEKLKGGENSKALSELFDGKLAKVITGPKSFQTENTEAFNDLSLEVKDCFDIDDSMKMYMAQETIDEYDTEQPDIGKCKVKMSKKFVELPAVLQIHLKRFEFDVTRYRTVKIDSQFAFGDALDLTKFMKDPSVCAKFRLFGVLVHSGDAYGGHYYVCLRPGCGKSWYRFNDTLVEQITAKEAIDANFGGTVGYVTYYHKIYSAYMLFYVREDMISRVFASCSDQDICEHIKKYAAQPYSNSDWSNIRKVTVITEEMLKRQPQEIGLSRPTEDCVVKIDNEMTISGFYTLLAEHFKLAATCFRLWHLDSSYRLQEVIPPNETLTVESFRPCLFFVQNKSDSESHILATNSMVLFVKCYTRNQSFPIFYMGSVVVSRDARISDFVTDCAAKLNVDASSLSVYRESSTTYQIHHGIKKWRDERVNNGDTILLQSTETLRETPAQFSQEASQRRASDSSVINYTDVIHDVMPTTAAEFMQQVSHVTTIRLCRYEDTRHLCDVRVPNSVLEAYDSLDRIKKFIIKMFDLSFDPQKDELLLFETSKEHRYPEKKPLIYLGSISGPLYYLHTKKSSSYLRATRVVRWSPDGYTVAERYCFFVENLTVSQIKALFAEKANGQPLRVFSVPKAGKIEFYKTDDLVADKGAIICGVIPEDQLGSSLSDLTVVTRAVVDEIGYLNAVEYPLLMRIGKEETIDVIRSRLAQILCDQQEAMKNARFMAVRDVSYTKFAQSKVLPKDARFGDHCVDEYGYKTTLVLLLPAASFSYDSSVKITN